MDDDKLISCEEAMKRLFEFLDNELDDHRHDEMEKHISHCRSCYSRSQFEKRLKQRLGEIGHHKASERLHNRIKQLINDK